ncbi:MAG: leucine-rich repeat domain-containing protein [Ruminococcaceae bacterium]|nr:leucine-rich repeat domain-containing protein [Oscillospiraceae bacterium]
MKKWLCMLLAGALVFSLTACHRNQQDNPDSSSINTETAGGTTEASVPPTENPKTDFQYEISTNGDAVYINKYIGASRNVVIPSQIDGLPVATIKGIAGEGGLVQEGAFEGCDIQSVTIPHSVTAIGLHAFKDCKELVQITIPDNLEILIDGAFQNCKKLESIDLSATKLTQLNELTFYDCVNLKEIALPSGLTRICAKAFYNCSSLLEINLPEELVRIDDAAFVNCASLKTITIQTKLNMISIKAPAFRDIPKLETIIFQEGCEKITGYGFFVTESNVEIKIPKSVTQFSPETFFIHGSAKVVFEGDCPEIVGENDFYGEPTIFYNPNTVGWDTCVWKSQYALKPIE